MSSGDSIPDLLYEESETALADALKSLLADRGTPLLTGGGWDKVLARTESTDTCDMELWRAVAVEVGCAGLLIPESAGGAGGSYREACTAAEALGGAVAPVPFLGSAVVATACLLASSTSSSREPLHLLGLLADGTKTAALTVPFTSAPGTPFPASVRMAGAHPGDKAAGVYRLRGSVRGVADALPANLLLVPADGVPRGLYAVDPASPRVTRTPVTSLDMTRQLCDVSFDDVPAGLIASGAEGVTALSAGLTAGACVIAAELLGVAERCLNMTVAYVKERRQFARPVGSFQALKHRLADLWVSVAQARAASRYAAACLASGSGFSSGSASADAPVAIAIAKSYCSEVAVHAAQECVQLHGGIGFTWEHPAHLYLKRAKADSLGFGAAEAHRKALAGLVNLPSP